MEDFLLIIGLVMAVVFTTAFIKGAAGEFKREHLPEEKAVLKAFVEDVVGEINKLREHYPNLDAGTVVKGDNSRKSVDQGNVYGDNLLLTFPIVTPSVKSVPPQGGRYLDVRDNMSLTVSGTLGKFKVEALAVINKFDTYKIIYSSKDDVFVEGLIHPKPSNRFSFGGK